MTTFGFPLLGVILLLSAASLAVLAAGGTRLGGLRVGLVASSIQLVLSLLVVANFDPKLAGFQFVESYGSIFTLGVDGVSLLFLPLTAVLTLMSVLSAENTEGSDTRRYQMCVLAISGLLMGAFMAIDAMLFWAFMTLELVPAYFLVALFGTGASKRSAANHYAAIMAISSALVLSGILIASNHVNTSTFQGLFAASISRETQVSVFFLILLGLAVKAPLFPFHSWLPRVLEQGPAVGGGVFLVGLKVGTYGILRLVLPIAPDVATEYSPWIIGIGALGLVYAGVIALNQTNLRRLLAFASVSHMGVVVVGLFSLNHYGIQGGFLQMLSLGMAVAGLYFVAGFIQQRVGATDMAQLGDLTSRTPLISLAFIVLAMAAVGMPGTSGFNGEHLVLIGALKVNLFAGLSIAFGTLLTAAYFLKFFRGAFLAPTAASQARPTLPDLRPSEKFISLVMVALVFVVGLYTGPFIRVSDGALKSVSSEFKGSTPASARNLAPAAPAALSQSSISQPKE